MELKLFRHLWGVDEPWETAFPKAKAAGYAGIECGLPAPDDEVRFRALLAAHQLDYIAQIYTTGGDVAAHVNSFRDQLVRAATFHPVLLTATAAATRGQPPKASSFTPRCWPSKRDGQWQWRTRPTAAASRTIRGARATCCCVSPTSS